ncbi:MAG: mannitol-1-phosphate 5-dehydrogenase [bacterium]
MKTAIQFGAGNIGRGFIGGLLANASYHVVFADVNETVINAINEQKEYKILVKDVECSEEVIKNISGVMSTDADAMLEKIKEASIITTAVGPLVLTRIAKTIADGIKARKDSNSTEPLNIIACENMVGGSSFLKEEVLKHLEGDYVSYLEENVGFPNSSVDRIVPPIKNENPLDVSVEKFYEWNVEEPKLKGEVPKIDGMTLVEDLSAYIERKLFTLNTGHAITAYLGFEAGHKTIDESINDPKIYEVVKSAMTESGDALIEKHKLDKEAHAKYIDKIINRFKNEYMQDDVLRVGREPLRKLSPKDRLINPLMTAYGYNLKTDDLVKGLASALHYFNAEDPQSVELKESIDSVGVVETLKKYCEVTDADLLSKIETVYNK